MKELVLLGINLMLLILVLKVFLKPAIIRFVRDKLFDGRDRMREEFLNSPQGLSDEAYLHAREIYNYCIRFIEDGSLVKICYFRIQINDDKETLDYLLKKIEKPWENCSPESMQMVSPHRKNANQWVSLYLLHSSLVPMLAFYFALLGVFPIVIFDAFRAHHWPRLKRAYRKEVSERFGEKILEGSMVADKPSPWELAKNEHQDGYHAPALP